MSMYAFKKHCIEVRLKQQSTTMCQNSLIQTFRWHTVPTHTPFTTDSVIILHLRDRETFLREVTLSKLFELPEFYSKSK